MKDRVERRLFDCFWPDSVIHHGLCTEFVHHGLSHLIIGSRPDIHNFVIALTRSLPVHSHTDPEFLLTSILSLVASMPDLDLAGHGHIVYTDRNHPLCVSHSESRCTSTDDPQKQPFSSDPTRR